MGPNQRPNGTLMMEDLLLYMLLTSIKSIQTTKKFETWRADGLYVVSRNLRFSNPKNMK